jgi:biopolymer transport protein ExbD
MNRIIFVLTLSIFSIHSFAATQKLSHVHQSFQQQANIELFIDAKGKVFVDGKKISMNKLEKILIEIKDKKGLVKFANDEKNTKMKGNRLEVMKLLRKCQISVEVYSDNTFSKVIRF